MYRNIQSPETRKLDGDAVVNEAWNSVHLLQPTCGRGERFELMRIIPVGNS